MATALERARPLEPADEPGLGRPAPPARQLRCCTASGCRAVGAEPLLQALRRAQGLAGPAAHGLVIQSVGCLRLCGRGPLLAWDGPGGPALFALGSTDPGTPPGAAIGPGPAQALVLAAATAPGPDALAALDLEAGRPPQLLPQGLPSPGAPPGGAAARMALAQGALAQGPLAQGASASPGSCWN